MHRPWCLLISSGDARKIARAHANETDGADWRLIFLREEQRKMECLIKQRMALVVRGIPSLVVNYGRLVAARMKFKANEATRKEGRAVPKAKATKAAPKKTKAATPRVACGVPTDRGIDLMPWQKAGLFVGVSDSEMLHDDQHPHHWTSDFCTVLVSGDWWEHRNRPKHPWPGAAGLIVVCPDKPYNELFPPYADDLTVAENYFANWSNFAIVRSRGDQSTFATLSHDARGMVRPCTRHHQSCDVPIDASFEDMPNFKAGVSVNELAVHSKLMPIPIGIQSKKRNDLAKYRRELSKRHEHPESIGCEYLKATKRASNMTVLRRIVQHRSP
eukprot:g6891.t1